MKKLLAVLLVLLLGLMASAALAAPELDGLEHNCPNTGVMVPAVFTPDNHNYLLTVASWVTNVRLTPRCSEPGVTITVAGKTVASGKASGNITMTDSPQQIFIRLTDSYGESTTYRVFLQRRPSERRTRTSYGYIDRVYQSKGSWMISADLVTVTTDRSGFVTAKNSASQLYRYACADECCFYTGSVYSPDYCANAEEFGDRYADDSLYRIIYIEDKIVAVLPFEADIYK